MRKFLSGGSRWEELVSLENKKHEKWAQERRGREEEDAAWELGKLDWERIGGCFSLLQLNDGGAYWSPKTSALVSWELKDLLSALLCWRHLGRPRSLACLCSAVTERMTLELRCCLNWFWINSAFFNSGSATSHPCYFGHRVYFYVFEITPDVNNNRWYY